MALVLRLEYTSINSDGTQITITDATGNYDASTNPGGYGTPNPDRSDIALFLRAYVKRFDGSDTITDTLLTDTPNDTDPTAVASWLVDVDKQGWHQMDLYGLNLYSTSILLNVNEIVWNAGTQQLIRILTRSGSGPYTYTYTTATLADLENSDYTTAYTAVLNSLVIPELCVCENKAVLFWSRTESEADFDKYLTIDGMLKAANYSFSNQDYTNAQAIVENVEDKCDCLNNECNC